jgi:DNA replication and repair protein RecF
MAAHGALLSRARAAAASRIVQELGPAFRAITDDRRAVAAHYAPGGPLEAGPLEEALKEHRQRDAHRGSATVGPHRDDLAIELDGHDARTDASQGEHRAITLALKLSELSCIAAARGVYPILLLDDVSSELDASRTALFFRHLRETPAQIFLTTTQRSLVDVEGLSAGERRYFDVSQGAVRPGG